MSRFSDVCDAFLADLQANVTGVNAASATAHLYAPWSPEELEADGRRHLAIWPIAAAQSATPLTLQSVELDQLYRILVWEDATTESTRGVTDTAATKTFYDLHDAIEARFSLVANEAMANAFRVQYQGTALPERSLAVRYFEMQVGVAFAIAYT